MNRQPVAVGVTVLTTAAGANKSLCWPSMKHDTDAATKAAAAANVASSSAVAAATAADLWK